MNECMTRTKDTAGETRRLHCAKQPSTDVCECIDANGRLPAKHAAHCCGRLCSTFDVVSDFRDLRRRATATAGQLLAKGDVAANGWLFTANGLPGSTRSIAAQLLAKGGSPPTAGCFPPTPCGGAQILSPLGPFLTSARKFLTWLRGIRQRPDCSAFLRAATC